MHPGGKEVLLGVETWPTAQWGAGAHWRGACSRPGAMLSSSCAVSHLMRIRTQGRRPCWAHFASKKMEAKRGFLIYFGSHNWYVGIWGRSYLVSGGWRNGRRFRRAPWREAGWHQALQRQERGREGEARNMGWAVLGVMWQLAGPGWRVPKWGGCGNLSERSQNGGVTCQLAVGVPGESLQVS